jgi:hypothetical protein
MFPNSNPPLVRVREHLSGRFGWMQSFRPVIRRRKTTPDVLPHRQRFGSGLLSAGALLAGVTAGATALYVFWIVYQDFSA